MRTEAQKESRRKYEASEKGKAARRRHELAYKASGKRKVVEQRREAKPISGARKAARKRWAKQNRWYFTADRAHRRFLAKYPVPPAEKAEIEGMYLFCNIFSKFEVDHIIPVKGAVVCGLHVLSNLQVIPRTQNRRKGAKFNPETAIN